MKKTQELPIGERGVVYLRVSSDKQDHLSQRQVIEAWLKQRGLTATTWYTDVGSRDLADKRPEFQRMLRDVETDQIDWVLVDAKDRFGTANAYEFGSYICRLRAHDCQLWSCSQGLLSGDDAVSAILSTVDSVRSRDEQVNKSSRSIRGAMAGAKKGQLQGGNPPYGFDTICCTPDGQEKWRVVYEAQHKRLRVWPTGRTERFDGKGNFPGRDPGEYLCLAPSRDKKRVENVRKIFNWFATESISLRGLCTRLNQLGVNPIIGDCWYVSRIRPLLTNSAYLLGQSVWNKNGHGRFLEWVDGEYKEVPKSKGKTKAGRRRAADQHILPETKSKGLIDQATWDRVQAKLAGPKRLAAVPRNDGLWLAGLVYCGQCGKKMVGWHLKSAKHPFNYTCPTYRLNGTTNPTGCRLHKINHTVLEPLIEKFLEETGDGLESLLSASLTSVGDDLIEGLLRQQEGKQLEFLKEVNRLYRLVSGGGKAKPPDGRPWTYKSLAAAYQKLAGGQRAETERRLAEKEAEMDQEIELFRKCKSQVAIDRANDRMLAVEAEILALRQQLEPVAEKVGELREELRRLESNIRAAQESLRGSVNLQKATALAAVVRRIVCTFDYTQAGQQTRSIPKEITIESVEATRTYAVSAAPGPDARAVGIQARFLVVGGEKPYSLS